MSWHDMVHGTMKERLEAVNWQEPPYSEHYPELAKLAEYFKTGAGIPPEGNSIVRNVCRGSWLKLRAPRDLFTIQDNLAAADPGFIDPDDMNFQLQDDSAAWELGFQPIPLERIGLHKSPYRRSLPLNQE